MKKPKSGKWRILARHKWVVGATITESVLESEDSDAPIHRFTATILGWRNWRIWIGDTSQTEMKLRVDGIVRKVKDIRTRIIQKDDSVFDDPQAW